MFRSVNESVTDIGMDVAKTPQEWNGDIFEVVRGLSETVIIPIAGLIISAVLCYELIQLIIDKNNLNDSGTYIFFKWIFKACIGIYAKLVQSIDFSGDLQMQLLKVVGLAVTLIMALFKTDSISKSIFGAS